MKVLIMGQVVEGSRSYVRKDGTKAADLRVFDGSDVTAVRVDPKYVDGGEAVPIGAQVRIPVYLRVFDRTINAEACNGVEVVAGGSKA